MSRNTARDVLIFAEDPGAANCVAALPEALARRGVTSWLLSKGLATGWFAQRGILPGVEAGNATAEEVLDCCSPRLALVGTAENRDTLGLHLVAEARRRGIVTAGIVDARPNADRRFKGRADHPLAFAPDWLLLPDGWTRDAFVGLGYPRDSAIVVGNPHYDHVVATAIRLDIEGRDAIKRRPLPACPDGRKVLVFATEGSMRVLSAYSEKPVAACRTEVVLQVFLRAVRGIAPRPYLVLRLHPKDMPEDYQDYLPAFEAVSAGGSPLELAFAADVVVGLTSMLLRETAMLGTPAVSVVPNAEERDLLADGAEGITGCPATEADLGRTLARTLTVPSRPLPKTGSRAVDRAVEVLAGLLQKSRLPQSVDSP